MNNNSNKKNKKTLKDFNLELGFVENNVFIAIARGIVFAKIKLTRGNTEIKSVFVHQKYRGKGIANALLDEIENNLGRTISIPEEFNYDFYRMILRRSPSLVAESLYQHKEQLFELKDIRCVILEVKNNVVLIEKNGILIELTRKDLISLNWISM